MQGGVNKGSQEGVESAKYGVERTGPTTLAGSHTKGCCCQCPGVYNKSVGVTDLRAGGSSVGETEEECRGSGNGGDHDVILT